MSSVKIDSAFKRFNSLEITGLGADVELVVMLGPNGTGKSSVFDALLLWARRNGRTNQGRTPSRYFDASGASQTDLAVRTHGDVCSDTDERLGTRVHVRTAHRHTPRVSTSSVRKPPKLDEQVSFDLMIDTDASLGGHYPRLVTRFLPVLSKLSGGDASHDLQQIRNQLEPLQSSLTRVLPYLRLAHLGDPSEEGSFYFVRNDGQEFRYENLSGGEKAVFDLLVDAHIAATELQDSLLVCIDEPELHLNPDVHGQVLTELLSLLPSGSQLWIATHSVGMIRRAFDIVQEQPTKVAFLDFGEVSGPSPDVRLVPVEPSRQLLQQALKVSLVDLAELLAPSVLVLCEGSLEDYRRAGFDERIYRQIFGHLFQTVDFVSCGSNTHLFQASSIARVVAPGTRILRLRDRDSLTDTDRLELLSKDPDLRVLERYSIESYLVDDEVLESLVSTRGCVVENALISLQEARDRARKRNGSCKASVGKVFEAAKVVLADIQQLGEDKEGFAVNVLAPLITPDTRVANELSAILKIAEP